MDINSAVDILNQGLEDRYSVPNNKYVELLLYLFNSRMMFPIVNKTSHLTVVINFNKIYMLISRDGLEVTLDTTRPYQYTPRFNLIIRDGIDKYIVLTKVIQSIIVDSSILQNAYRLMSGIKYNVEKLLIYHINDSYSLNETIQILKQHFNMEEFDILVKIVDDDVDVKTLRRLISQIDCECRNIDISTYDLFYDSAEAYNSFINLFIEACLVNRFESDDSVAKFLYILSRTDPFFTSITMDKINILLSESDSIKCLPKAA